MPPLPLAAAAGLQNECHSVLSVRFKTPNPDTSTRTRVAHNTHYISCTMCTIRNTRDALRSTLIVVAFLVELDSVLSPIAAFDSVLLFTVPSFSKV